MTKKWTASEKARIVMESLTTNISTAELCRKHNVSPNTFYPWKERFLEHGKNAFAGVLGGNVCKQVAFVTFGTVRPMHYLRKYNPYM